MKKSLILTSFSIVAFTVFIFSPSFAEEASVSLNEPESSVTEETLSGTDTNDVFAKAETSSTTETDTSVTEILADILQDVEEEIRDNIKNEIVESIAEDNLN